ncbi:TPA: restriction endonuclease subunit S [Vibrio alginolyticus]|nr:MULTISPECIES: restriction endonuclease subunit S [Vibrio]ELA9386619.1 restriction endonuclease subunit S [Vibrio parahaemolyticus]EHA1205657.1 restriction endonuclease subunit S [Vibrio alginolyticus]MBS9820057.1 restriction endonuclease subunit S [Vibrio alginolyticus]MBS9981027.1 restriction endonuclease subunit S [Vibrio alginolyticus]MBT0017505.1 restriction endonuclease subunit S [Vibrio alginolyticus]
MKSECGKKVKLSELITIKHGYAFKGSSMVDYPTSEILVTPGNFAIGGGFKSSKLKFHSGDIPEGYQLSPGQLVVTMTDLSKDSDTLGYSALIPDDGFTYLHNQRIGLVDIKDEKQIDKLFLYFLMRTPSYRHEVLASSTGTSVKHTSPTKIMDYAVNLPPINIQKKIAGYLYDLELKINNNKAMNQTLEKLAQRIFKSWFIDFDPVKANKEGLPFDGLSPEIQALFPSEFEDSELGMIPKGWEVTPLSKVVKLTGGGTPKRSEPSYWNGEIPWFSMKDAPENGEVFVIDTEEKITELGLQKSSTKLLPRGTTIITARGTVGKLALVATDMCMNQSCYGVRGTEVGDYFNYFNLKQAISTLKQNVHGAVFDTITTNTFDTYSFAFSGSEIANAYNELIAPLLEKSEINARQNITLTRLRDRLLPKLVSGQISVGEVAQELAEAV